MVFVNFEEGKNDNFVAMTFVIYAELNLDDKLFK